MRENSSTRTAPFSRRATPQFSSPSPTTSGLRPVAKSASPDRKPPPPVSRSRRRSPPDPPTPLPDGPGPIHSIASTSQPNRRSIPARPHLVGEMAANLLVEAAQEELAAVDQGDLAPEPGQDARELDADVASPDHREALWQTLQVKGLVRGDGVLDAGDLRPVRPASGRHQDVLGADLAPYPVAEIDLHPVRVDQTRPTLEEFHTCAFEQPAVDSVQTLDLPVLVGDETRPVERGRSRGPAESRSFAVVVGKGRRTDEELLRHAADVHTRAAQVAGLGDCHPRAVAGSHPGGAHAARTCADHEKVVVVVRHGRNGRRIRNENRPLPAERP